MGTLPNAPDCRTCGACRGPDEDQVCFVDLTEADVQRVSRSYRARHVHWSGDHAALTTKRGNSGCVCVALVGGVGRRVRCAIYERRPAACRAFRPGSRDCRAVRSAVLGRDAA
jgi:Fe-S-cluster containining protein